MPTEECFTTPKKGVAEGHVVATMPLSYQGEVIDGFWFDFKDGKVVKYGAKQNEELLGQMLDMDENSRYMGEVALVPKESPINQMGILFYSTLKYLPHHLGQTLWLRFETLRKFCASRIRETWENVSTR